MYSTYNEGTSIVAERFIRFLRNKIYKHMTAVRRNVYFDVLDDIVDKYNNTYHKTTKMKPIDLKSDSYSESTDDSNEIDTKFQLGDHVRISKYENVFAKGYTLDRSEEFFVINKVKNTVRWTYVLMGLNGEEILESFKKKNCISRLMKKFRVKTVIKRKGIKQYVKWKGYDNSFNSRIDKKRHCIK